MLWNSSRKSLSKGKARDGKGRDMENPSGRQTNPAGLERYETKTKYRRSRGRKTLYCLVCAAAVAADAATLLLF